MKHNLDEHNLISRLQTIESNPELVQQEVNRALEFKRETSRVVNTLLTQTDRRISEANYQNMGIFLDKHPDLRKEVQEGKIITARSGVARFLVRGEELVHACISPL